MGDGSRLEIIILAAGQGSRMRSSKPKVLHALAGKPLLAHVLETARGLKPDTIHVVVGHGAEAVKAATHGQDLTFHHQAEQLGTGHAVACALPSCHSEATVLVLFGDVPLMSGTTLARLLKENPTHPTMLAACLDDPTGYGRVLRDENDGFAAVVEQADATERQHSVKEANTGVLAAPAQLLSTLLASVGNDNAQGEYYLPDALALAVGQGIPVGIVVTDDPHEIAGVNDRIQLEALERDLQHRLADALMRTGVAITDRRRVDIRGDLQCGQDVEVDINAVFEGRVILGDGVRIGANCFLKDVVVGADTEIQPFCHIEGASIGVGCRIGPYARLRPGTELAETARVGNFVETKNTVLGSGSKANHLAYLGDTRVGENSNIGAGTITCNYDGVNKHPTTLGAGVFVGSNSTLVAPVTLADRAFVAAGSVVTDEVPEENLAVGRSRQRNVSGWKPPGTGEG
ncbi:MAG: bifunctional UDP-N-acetylglucosamine diphosphorylase/glucosamine-1-phosphate N-acetyltransferase GlmU [Luminiphilus sp.]|nr:bifunctional UDP-N-acetylglucosamine diphosphorylase/glucosamine-1-phosphate N-acetyltransferase GlmU [Luminiphilus sp.]